MIRSWIIACSSLVRRSGCRFGECEVVVRRSSSSAMASGLCIHHSSATLCNSSAWPVVEQSGCRVARSLTRDGHVQRRRVKTKVVHRDLTADILEKVASLALRARLKECKSVKTSVSCDTWSLIAGRVNNVKIVGEGWKSPLTLTAQVLEATVGEATIDPSAVLFKQQIQLTNTPVGTARVVFSSEDFGNFLVHPLMVNAVQTAVQGHAFAFDQHSVRIQPPAAAPPAGMIEFTGTWRGDGHRYQVRLQPVTGGAALGRGVQAHAVPLSIGGRSSAASIVEDELTKFFNNLKLDLQGAELSFMSLGVTSGLGFAGAMADLHLRLELRQFPPLNVQF